MIEKLEGCILTTVMIQERISELENACRSIERVIDEVGHSRVLRERLGFTRATMRVNVEILRVLHPKLYRMTTLIKQ